MNVSVIRFLFVSGKLIRQYYPDDRCNSTTKCVNTKPRRLLSIF